MGRNKDSCGVRAVGCVRLLQMASLCLEIELTNKKLRITTNESKINQRILKLFSLSLKFSIKHLAFNSTKNTDVKITLEPGLSSNRSKQ